jgi:hypothetical protein
LNFQFIKVPKIVVYKLKVNSYFLNFRLMANPDSKAVYQVRANGMKSVFNVALADFMHAPEIYTIGIRVTDDFNVEQVHVSITATDGTLIEDGNVENRRIMWISSLLPRRQIAATRAAGLMFV